MLTETEKAIVKLVAQGLSNKEISERLGNSPNTVDTHLTNIRNKLGTNNRVKLTNWAIKEGLHDPAKSETNSGVGDDTGLEDQTDSQGCE